MDVIIDGKRYIPEEQAEKKIGIAISTRNRHDVLKRTLEQHEKFLPPNAVVYIVDDGSDTPVKGPEWAQVHRHEKSEGIVAVKNTSLQLLIDAGCEHLYLWDDDAFPIAENWWVPYMESPEPHLGYQFKDLAGKRKINDTIEVFNDGKHFALSGQRGVMLYYHKSAIDKVGGFDPIYQRGMYEHVDLALRIHNAGLTTFPFGDVVGSNKLIYSLDEHEEVTRSVPPADRQQQVERNVKIYSARRRARYSGFAPYRKPRRVVMTCLLTGCVDPQRNQHMQATPALLQAWANSIKGAEKIVFADQLSAMTGVNLIKVPEVNNLSPYFLRWLHIYQYLRDNPDIEQVWCTDGTDVIMLREPWESMEPGKLYVGNEHTTYSNPWFDKVNHQKYLKKFIQENKDQQVVNAGIIGGSREDVMKVAHGMIAQVWKMKSEIFWREETGPESATDMIMFGIEVFKFGENLVHGPIVNTVFKGNGHGNDIAFWQHK